jgi:hypothetical protein
VLQRCCSGVLVWYHLTERSPGHTQGRDGTRHTAQRLRNGYGVTRMLETYCHGVTNMLESNGCDVRQ